MLFYLLLVVLALKSHAVCPPSPARCGSCDCHPGDVCPDLDAICQTTSGCPELIACVGNCPTLDVNCAEECSGNARRFVRQVYTARQACAEARCRCDAVGPISVAQVGDTLQIEFLELMEGLFLRSHFELEGEELEHTMSCQFQTQGIVDVRTGRRLPPESGPYTVVKVNGLSSQREQFWVDSNGEYYTCLNNAECFDLLDACDCPLGVDCMVVDGKSTCDCGTGFRFNGVDCEGKRLALVVY